jgi:hypothetical protein
MKIRAGFVSNSSSSSFTCDYCKGTNIGYNQEAEELRMYYCDNGHLICGDHIDGSRTIDWEKLREEEAGYCEDDEKQKILDMDEDDFNEYYRNRVGTPPFSSEQCPLCNLSNISDEDYQWYITVEYGLSKYKVLEEIKSKFKNYNEMSEYLGKKRDQQ